MAASPEALLNAAANDTLAATPTPRWGRLPEALRVLFITSRHRTGAWLAQAFAADRAVKVAVEEALGAAAGMARLREEQFDAVLVSHEHDDLDGLDLVEALRAADAEEAVILLGSASAQEIEPLAFEVGADGYLCVHTATTRGLIWLVARAVERRQLIRENRRLTQIERRRLEHELREADRLLNEQRALVHDLETLGDLGGAPNTHGACAAMRDGLPHLAAEAVPLHEALVAHYRELLRAYVIMGSGNIVTEMSTLGELLASTGMSAAQTMQLHLAVLEEQVRGLGSRSARHVMARADLLALEMMVHLAEAYRRRCVEQATPQAQLLLPGFLETAAAASHV